MVNVLGVPLTVQRFPRPHFSQPLNESTVSCPWHDRTTRPTVCDQGNCLSRAHRSFRGDCYLSHDDTVTWGPLCLTPSLAVRRTLQSDVPRDPSTSVTLPLDPSFLTPVSPSPFVPPFWVSTFSDLGPRWAEGSCRRQETLVRGSSEGYPVGGRKNKEGKDTLRIPDRFEQLSQVT